MADFDQRNQDVRNQYNAGRDINYEANYPLYVAPKPPAAQRTLGGVVALIFFVVFVGFGAYMILHSFPGISSGRPDAVLSDYCTRLQSGDYQGAYNDYSSGLKSQISSADFARMWANKPIHPCLYNISSSSDQSASAMITITEFPSNSPTNYSVMLIKDSNGDWKIDSFQQAG